MKKLSLPPGPIRALSVAALLLGIAGLLPVRLPAQVLFSVTDLGTLGGTNSSAVDVNNAGQVAGNSAVAGDASSRAFLYNPGVGLTDLGALGGTHSTANALNAAGQVVGSAAIAGDAAGHAFLYSGGVMTSLGTLGGTQSVATGINAAGTIVGGSGLAGDAVYRGFVYSGGTMTALPTPAPEDSVFAHDINSGGTIVGAGRFYQPPGIFSPYFTRLFTHAGGVTTLHDNPADNSTTLDFAINDAGVIVGRYHTPGSTPFSIVKTPEAGAYGSLFNTYLGGDEANDINNANIVVGSANIAPVFGSPDPYAYRYDYNLQELTNLNDLVDLAGSGFTRLIAATAISNNGHVVGQGLRADGSTHAFLLAPNHAMKFWDSNGAVAGLAPGDGVWSLEGTQWTNDTTGTSGPIGWTNGHYARFQPGSDFTVTLADNLSTSGFFYTSGNNRVTIVPQGAETLTLVNDARINVGNTSEGLDLGVTLAGTVGLNKYGTGTLRLSGDNTYTGQTVQHGGYIVVAHANGLGASGAGNETILAGDSFGVLGFAGSFTVNETIRVDRASRLQVEHDTVGGVARNVTLAGPIVLGSSLALMADAGDSLTLSGAISQLPGLDFPPIIEVYRATLTGTNTFTETLHVPSASGGLTVPVFNDNGVAGPLGAGTGLSVGFYAEGYGPGRVSYTGGTATSNRTIRIDGSEAIFNVVSPTAHLTLTGAITQGFSPAGRFIKDGPGQLTLAAASTYGGGTEVTQGTLRLANLAGSALGSGNVVVHANGRLTGSGTFPGDLDMLGTYAPGDGIGGVTLTGDVSVAGSGWLEFEIGGLARGTQHDFLDIEGLFSSTGSLRVTLANGFMPAVGDSFNLLDWTMSGGISFASFDLQSLAPGLGWDTQLLGSSGVLSVQAIPEPSTYGLLAVGLGWVCLRRGRRRERE